MTKTINLEAQLELLKASDGGGEAFSSITSLNPNYQWAKIVVTDDQPNINKMRIPLEEYENLIRTGVHSPIKMAENEISGHADAKPIGTMTHLKKEGSILLGLAALWKHEREDINMLKEMYSEGTPPNVSWEIAFSEKKEDDEGVSTLYGTTLNGISVVANPAYAGRTRFVAMSENKNIGDETVEELEKAQARIKELEVKLEAVSNYDDILAKLKQSEEELAELREFKAEVDKLQADAQKLKEIKDKFAEAGLEKEDSYFEEKKETFLTMSEEAIDFMIQEMVAFAEKAKELEEENKVESSLQIPNITEDGKLDLSNVDPKKLGEALRNLEK